MKWLGKLISREEKQIDDNLIEVRETRMILMRGRTAAEVDAEFERVFNENT
jgi:hypothetical protein